MTRVHPRMIDALRYLTGEFSVDRDEFCASQKQGSAMLLDGMLSSGLTIQRGDRIGVSARGREALAQADRR